MSQLRLVQTSCESDAVVTVRCSKIRKNYQYLQQPTSPLQPATSVNEALSCFAVLSQGYKFRQN